MVIVLASTPTPSQLEKIKEIFAALSGLPLSAFTLVLLQARSATVQAEISGQNAGAAGTNISKTLAQDSNYLTNQDASLPKVTSSSVQPPTDSTNLLVIIIPAVVGGVVLIGLVVLIAFLVIRRKRSNEMQEKISAARDNSGIELAGGNPNPGYGRI